MRDIALTLVTAIICFEFVAIVLIAVGIAVEVETGAHIGYMLITAGGGLAIISSIVTVKFRPILNPTFEAFFKRLREGRKG